MSTHTSYLRLAIRKAIKTNPWSQGLFAASLITLTLPTFSSELPVIEPFVNTSNLRQGENNKVIVRTTPIPNNLTEGSTFDVTVQVHADEHQPIDLLSASLNFNPEMLQANDLDFIAGNFDLVWGNSFNNELGHIDVTILALDIAPPTGSFDVFTVNFTLLKPGGEKTIAFNTGGLRETSTHYEDDLATEVQTLTA